MIQVENLTKRYGDFTAIEDVTFSVGEGEVVGFLGPNAAGKTTTMRILTCFMPATDGTARVAGYDVFNNPLEVRKRIGYLPENVPLYTEMTVKSYLNFMASIKGVDKSKRRQMVDSVIESCGLEKFRDRIVGKLSKGYRQRVGLAQALVHNPQVLILDEPTIGLDPKQIIEIRNLIKSLGGEHTVILSTHILPEASMICNRIIIINEGRIAGTVTLRDGKVAIIEFQALEKLEKHEGEDFNQALVKLDGGATTGITRKLVNLEESGNVQLQVQGPSDKVLSRLKLDPQIVDVRLEHEDNGTGTYIVTHESGVDIRAKLASMIVYSGWEVLELRPVEMTLEEVFLELTRENVFSKLDDMNQEPTDEKSDVEAQGDQPSQEEERPVDQPSQDDGEGDQ